MDITQEVIERATNLVKKVSQDYQEKINMAYLDTEDELSIAFKVTFRPKGDGVHIKVDLNFVADRVKDSAEDTVQSGAQMVIDFVPPREVRKAGRTRGEWVKARSFR